MNKRHRDKIPGIKDQVLVPMSFRLRNILWSLGLEMGFTTRRTGVVVLAAFVRYLLVTHPLVQRRAAESPYHMTFDDLCKDALLVKLGGIFNQSQTQPEDDDNATES